MYMYTIPIQHANLQCVDPAFYEHVWTAKHADLLRDEPGKVKKCKTTGALKNMCVATSRQARLYCASRLDDDYIRCEMSVSKGIRFLFAKPASVSMNISQSRVP